MATKPTTIEFIAEQIRDAGSVTFKKMFGEYMVYCNGKPVFLVCDDTLYIKILPETEAVVRDKLTGHPYNGARLHYIIEDLDDAEYLTMIAVILEKITPFPKPKKKV